MSDNVPKRAQVSQLFATLEPERWRGAGGLKRAP